MTVKEIINTSAALLRLEDITERDTELLLRCFNLIYTEIACDYIPLIETETARGEEGKIEYSDLEKTPLNIIRIEKAGASCKFQMRPAYFTAPDGEVSVTYSYLPEEAAIDDEVEYGAKISPSVFAYGVAAEFCLINGDFEESQMWDRRYRDGLVSACRQRREVRIPRRGWY